MRICRRPSPNHGPRAARVDMLILHYTGMVDAASALDRLCSAAAEVSAHYLIEEDGTIWQLVDETRRAWHAGRSSWAGASDINDRSVGIELANPGHEFGYRAFPAAQIDALIALSRGIIARHDIAPARVLGHSDVAPQRKEDPGELFPWPRLAEDGIGIWPDFGLAVGTRLGRGATLAARRGLARIGYEVATSGPLDDAMRAVVTAFQRHWRPSCCDGVLDGETAGRIAILAETVALPS